MLVGAAAAAAACGDYLGAVDAAFAKPGGRAAHLIKEQLCPRCDIVEACFLAGMLGEAGVWGGTTPKVRNRHGSPKTLADRRRAIETRERRTA